MRLDLEITNARVVLGEEQFSGSIGVVDGKVASLSSRGSVGVADRTIDANGKTVIPGVVDVHSHYGLGSDADFSTETRAAAQAGITTTISYLLKREDDYADAFDEMRRQGEQHSLIDFGFHFGASSTAHAQALGRWADQFGVTSHKYFTSFKRPGEGDYIGVNPGNDGLLYQIMREIAKDPRMNLVVHSETIEIVWSLAEELQGLGVGGLAAWDASRPDFTEADAIATVARLAHVTGARVYIPHVSTRAGLEVAAGFGSRRPLIETCPHYLTHTYEDRFDGSLGKVNPPLRSSSDRDALWAGIDDGTVDVIGSDHNSRPRSRKMTDIWAASAGFPSQGTMLPAVITEGVSGRGIPLARLVQLLCSAPARIFGRYPQKGTLLPGSDADFSILDLDTPRQVDVRAWGSRADYSLDEGIELVGWPLLTFLRGERVWSKEAGWTDDARGRYVPGAMPSYAHSGRVAVR